MRIVIALSALIALASAFPRPQGQDDPTTADPEDDPEDPITISAALPTPTTPLPFSKSAEMSITVLPTSTKKNPHWEPIPIFTKPCQCDLATARYPCWATDALQVCRLKLCTYLARLI